MNNFKELTDFLDEHVVEYTIHPDCVEVDGDLSFSFFNLTSLPDTFGYLKVNGSLFLSDNQLTSLPETFGKLTVNGELYLNDNPLDFDAWDENSPIQPLLDNNKISGYIHVSPYYKSFTNICSCCGSEI